MKQDIKTKWVEALRSGKYQQGDGVLHSRKDNKYCCLGVLCDLAFREGVVTTGIRETTDGSETTTFGEIRAYERLPMEVVVWAGLDSLDHSQRTDPNVKWEDDDHDEREDSLSELNDNYGQSFTDLAYMIEESL